MYKMCAVHQSSIWPNRRGWPRELAEPAPLFVGTRGLFGRASTPAVPTPSPDVGAADVARPAELSIVCGPADAPTALLFAPELVGRVMAKPSGKN